MVGALRFFFISLESFNVFISISVLRLLTFITGRTILSEKVNTHTLVFANCNFVSRTRISNFLTVQNFIRVIRAYFKYRNCKSVDMSKSLRPSCPSEYCKIIHNLQFYSCDTVCLHVSQ